MNLKIERIFEIARQLCSSNRFDYWKLVAKLKNVKVKENLAGFVEDGVSIKGSVWLSGSSIIKSGTVIEGSAYIGPNSVIGPNAYLRGFVAIEANNKISNSEIKNAVILKNTNVPHFSYVGDSVIGENVNLGAGTKIANLRFDEQTVKVDLFGKRVDSKLRKLGALIKNNVRIGINVSINCGIIICENSTVFPGEFVNRSIPKNSAYKFRTIEPLK